MIARSTVIYLGLSQLTCWGLSYYLIGAFGPTMAADLGWSPSLIYGGFSVALVTMGVTSPTIGKAIDRFGGRPVMIAGSVGLAIGCGLLAVVETVPVYVGAWVILGISMRLSLYDAAFATLAHLAGAAAKRPIAHVTLLGGLASTVFWPLGNLLIAEFGWRGALWAYTAIALCTLPLHMALPKSPPRTTPAPSPAEPTTVTRTVADRRLAALFYALIVTAANFLNAGLSAHMIGILVGLGLALPVAVSIAGLRGIGQSLARLADVLFGRNVPALRLNLVATSLLAACFLFGFFAGHWLPAVLFAFLYGAGNGLLTITRGTLPLVLFDHRIYGQFVGRLLAPSFLFAAAAPVVYAHIIEHFSAAAALWFSLGLALIVLYAAQHLARRFSKRPQLH